MAFSKAKKLTRFLTASLVVGIIGCGSASNNDQGTSVTAVGYFADAERKLGLTGSIVPLSEPVASINLGLGDLDGQTVIVFFGIDNNLSNNQDRINGGPIAGFPDPFVRVERIDCDYTVAGADAGLRIPSDSFAVGMVIQPSGGQGTAGFEIVSPDLFAFFNANRLSLPELPFRAVAVCRGIVVTRAGDTLSTNTLNFTLQFGEVEGLGGGSFGSTGGGGDLTTFGGNAAAGAVVVENPAGAEGPPEETTADLT